MCDSVLSLLKHHQSTRSTSSLRAAAQGTLATATNGICLLRYDPSAQAKRTTDVLSLVHMAISKNPGHKTAAQDLPSRWYRRDFVAAQSNTQYCGTYSEYSYRVQLSSCLALGPSEYGLISESQLLAKQLGYHAICQAWADLTAVRLLAPSPSAASRRPTSRREMLSPTSNYTHSRKGKWWNRPSKLAGVEW